MAEPLMDALSIVVELLDTLSGLIYPPPRRLFSDVIPKSRKPQPKPQLWHLQTVIWDDDSSTSNTTRTSFTSDVVSVGRVITVPTLFECPSLTPALFLDAEGVRLSRTGKLSIVQLHIHHRFHQRTYLVDVHTLKEIAFITKSTDGRITLKSLLEDPEIPKVFFDVRMDFDALYGHYGISLAGVIDLQLMELASRMKQNLWAGGCLKSLRLCLAEDVNMKDDERERVEAVKDQGKALFASEKGGYCEIFNERPLSQAMIDYCIADVAFMPRMFEKYNLRLGNKVSLTEQMDEWACRINDATKDRVLLAQNPHFTGGSWRGPWSGIW